LVYVERVEIRWLRGVREGFVDGFSDFTVLVGRNGVGKSTVLEAFYLVSAWLQPVDEIRKVGKLDYLISRRGGRGSWNKSREILWYGLNVERDVIVRLSIGEDDVEFVINYDSASIWLRTDSLKDIYKELGIPEDVMFLRFDYHIPIAEAVFSEHPSHIVRHRKTANNVLDWLKKRVPQLVEVLNNVILIDSQLMLKPEVIEEFAWSKILAKRLDKEVAEMVRRGFEEDAEGITYAPVGGVNTLMLQLRETSIRVDDVGEGAKNAILMLMVIMAAKPKLILIEEPEIKMHPSGLRTFTETLTRVAKGSGSQVVVTTHSIEFIKIAMEVSANAGLEFSLMHVTKENGKLNIRKLSKPDTKLIIDLGIDPRFLDLF